MKSADPLADTLRMWLKVFMHRSMHDYIQFSKDNKLSMSHIGALGLIERKGAEAVSNIGENLGISKAAASQLLDKLVQDGLVSRTEDPEDRRKKQIALTDKGRQLMQEGMRARMKWLEELAAVMSPDEQAQVRAALNVLIEKADLLEKSPQQET